MVTMKCVQFLAQLSRRRASALGAVALLLALIDGCGRPDGLVVVNVSGLDSTITELQVTITLDGVSARNLQQTADDPTVNSFSVFKDMQSFGIEVPSGTQVLGVNIDGLNTSRVARRSGSGQVDVSQHQELAVELR